MTPLLQSNAEVEGRAFTPDRLRRRTICSSARGAKQEAPHEPLQRLLGVAKSDCVSPQLTAYLVRKSLSNPRVQRLSNLFGS